MTASLPAAYAWLADEGAPKMLVEALALYGIAETPGAADNPVILGWAKEVGLSKVYSGDEIPWCGLFMAVVAKRATWDFSPGGNPLWARNWALWGTEVATPMLGDVMIFARGDGGHVAQYVGEDATHWHILGANQSDRVCIVRKAKSPAPLAVRRAPWRIAQPANVRRVVLASTGAPVSTKEH